MKDSRPNFSIPLLYMALLLGVSIALGALHYFFHDFRAGGIYWFNLDKERNLPTWFSGILFFLFGLFSSVAFWLEWKQNRTRMCFKNPYLWLVAAGTGFAMSLDETTILHENLYWREIREFSSTLGSFSYYITQWQILFAPLVVVIFAYFILLFLNRFSISQLSLFLSFMAIASWLTAFLLEGLREAFRSIGPNAYLIEVLIEEELEMTGAVFLVGALGVYLTKISSRLSDTDRDKLVARLICKKTVLTLFAVVCLWVCIGGIYYYFASELAKAGAPVPNLMEKVLRGKSIH